MSRRAPGFRAVRSIFASRKAHFPSRLSWAGALWVGCRPKSRNGCSSKSKQAVGPWHEAGMPDALALRTETGKDIREVFDQSIEGAETDSEVLGHCLDSPREEIVATVALDEPTVLAIEPPGAGKGGEGGDFQITNAEFIAAVFSHLPDGASAAVC